MAAPSSKSQTPSIAQNSAWQKSGDPTPAPNGSGRGRGRALGRGRGRGGRGGGGSVRDTKSVGTDATNGKLSITSKTATLPSKPVAHPLPADDKPSASPTSPAPTRQKPGSRRSSRVISPAVLPDLNGTKDIPISTKPTRPPNRNRRSISGKHVPSPLPLISHDDNLLRPQRHRFPQTPHTAPIKDTPHSPGGPSDMRHDIDALVERVRAVAMAENRPNTPGSHIDWAGDDDDSLPDLDDWGVVAAIPAQPQNDTISPIAVDGLKTLPDIHTEHPLPTTQTSSGFYNKLVSGGSLHEKATVITSRIDTSLPVKLTNPPQPDEGLVTPITTTRSPLIQAPEVARVSLHPSLPPKPVEAPSIPSYSRPSQGASPMRQHHNTTSVDVSEKPFPASSGRTDDAPTPVVVIEEFQTEQQAAEPNADLPEKTANPFAKFSYHEGLAASIHAPTSEGSESRSVSNEISYSPPVPEHRTHARAHTIGRPYRPENNGRPSRSGYNTPRSYQSGEGGHHTRTHSTPPTGQYNHRNAAHRPIITGDAITRLARTIGSATISAGRAAVATAAQD